MCVLFSLFLVTVVLSQFGSHITNLKLCKIQGAGYRSPYEGDFIQAQGVVTLDLDDTTRRGFFLQTEQCDSDPRTSDGIFVYLGERIDVVNPGDLVQVAGEVQEYYGLTEIRASPIDVSIISSGNPLPLAVELQPPMDNTQASHYWESLEAMYISLGLGTVIGPTDLDDRSWLVRTDLGITRVFQDDPNGTGEVICSDDAGRYEIVPEAKVSDQVQNILGVLDESAGEYCVQLDTQPSVISGQGDVQDKVISAFIHNQDLDALLEFSIATFNLANMFDTYDDPATNDTVLSTTEYQRRLQKRALTIRDMLNEPTILGLQEVENAEVLQGLINRPEISAPYQFILQDGPDQRGIDVALMYRTDRALLISSEVRQACTGLVDGLGPDGNGDVYNPVNKVTCDTNYDGIPDGNRLFSRPPLVARLGICRGDCQPTGLTHVKGQSEMVEVWVIVNHWKSKLQDSDRIQYTLPRRIEQAHLVAQLVNEILLIDASANIIVLGDLNDYPNSQPLLVLDSLDNQVLRLPKPERYTYIYRGRSQVLDHLLLRTSPWLSPVEISAMHVNSDYPEVFAGVSDSYYRSSDHDPLLVLFREMNQVIFMPVVGK